MNLTAFRLELRRGRTLLTWLAIVTALYAGFITLFYANVAQNAAAFEDLLKLYPKELMLAFGIEGNFADPAVFLTGYVFNFLWPFIGAIAAIVLATRVAADADRGFLDIALATPIARVRYLAASIVTQVVGLTVLAVAMIAAIVAADLFIEPDFPTGNIVLSILPSLAFGVAIAGPSTLLAVLLLDRGRAAGIAAGVIVLMYLLNVIAAIAPDYDALAAVSAFHYFDLKGLIRSGEYPVGDTLVFLVVGGVGWLLSLLAFRRRDLAA
jgi:ABC-2 type transport system permease protein